MKFFVYILQSELNNSFYIGQTSNVDERIKYITLQANVGDKAIFLQKGAVEVIYNNEKYFINNKYS